MWHFTSSGLTSIYGRTCPGSLQSQLLHIVIRVLQMTSTSLPSISKFRRLFFWDMTGVASWLTASTCITLSDTLTSCRSAPYSHQFRPNISHWKIWFGSGPASRLSPYAAGRLSLGEVLLICLPYWWLGTKLPLTTHRLIGVWKTRRIGLSS